MKKLKLLFFFLFAFVCVLVPRGEEVKAEYSSDIDYTKATYYFLVDTKASQPFLGAYIIMGGDDTILNQYYSYTDSSHAYWLCKVGNSSGSTSADFNSMALYRYYDSIFPWAYTSWKGGSYHLLNPYGAYQTKLFELPSSYFGSATVRFYIGNTSFNGYGNTTNYSVRFESLSNDFLYDVTDYTVLDSSYATWLSSSTTIYGGLTLEQLGFLTDSRYLLVTIPTMYNDYSYGRTWYSLQNPPSRAWTLENYVMYYRDDVNPLPTGSPSPTVVPSPTPFPSHSVNIVWGGSVPGGTGSATVIFDSQSRNISTLDYYVGTDPNYYNIPSLYFTSSDFPIVSNTYRVDFVNSKYVKITLSDNFVDGTTITLPQVDTPSFDFDSGIFDLSQFKGTVNKFMSYLELFIAEFGTVLYILFFTIIVVIIAHFLWR